MCIISQKGKIITLDYYYYSYCIIVEDNGQREVHSCTHFPLMAHFDAIPNNKTAPDADPGIKLDLKSPESESDRAAAQNCITGHSLVLVDQILVVCCFCSHDRFYTFNPSVV